MTLEQFLQYVHTRGPLKGPEIGRFMNEMSDEARRITFRLNAAYHTPEEVRALLSELFGRPVDDTLRVFPPFYTDFGKNITLGREVFINACCHAARSATTSSLPPSTTASPPKIARPPTRPPSCWDATSGSAPTPRSSPA